MKKKIYITGESGFVGQKLIQRGCFPLAVDVTNDREVFSSIASLPTDSIVIHLAAKTDVDWCERNHKEAFDVNVAGTLNVAEACMRASVSSVLVSTDHVFGGHRGPYREAFNPRRDPPLNYYGITKMAAEGLANANGMKIVRSSTLFDGARLPKPLRGFPDFLHRSFLHVDHFADALLVYVERFAAMPPLLHISGTRVVSIYEFAKRVGLSPHRRSRELEIDTLAPRPHRGGLVVLQARRLGLPVYSYEDGIDLL